MVDGSGQSTADKTWKGIVDLVVWSQMDASHRAHQHRALHSCSKRWDQVTAAPERGVILSNPPYGERIAAEELKRLYSGLGEWCRRFPGWRAAFLVANKEFEESFGKEPRIRKPLRTAIEDPPS